MKVIVSGREVFGPTSSREGLSWGEFVTWTGLNQVEELVSLDSFYNGPIEGLQGVYDTQSDLVGKINDFVHEMVEEKMQHTGLPSEFSLLAILIYPLTDDLEVLEGDFEFIGYDIVHQSAGHSVLVQLGWMAGMAFHSEVNRYGLLESAQSASLLLASIRNSFPEMEMVDGSVAAVWRHRTIGRNTLFTRVKESEAFVVL
ncbi:hypothetical protein [Lunatimonas salinarum]|uniref:hypothetical protein n=1 Tax=Lunatimonas salinarum TaxID=1774590 RepID=UPI001ADF5531|nr:hypothetical protein [Lunatimonas salinarum]